jgi:hypothetical protein
MTAINLGEYGQKVYANMGQDVSNPIHAYIYLEPQIGETKKRAATVGTVNITVDDQNLIANEYLEYTLADGDINYQGTWRVVGECLLTSTYNVKSDYSILEVMP